MRLQHMILEMPPIAIPFAVHQGDPAIDALRWERRVLLVFAGNERDPRLAEQRAANYANRAGFRDRHLIIVEVVGDSVSGVRDYAPRLRRRYRVADDAFTSVLVGKDGESKLRSHAAIDAPSLFATIDAMPMRVREAAAR